MNKQKASILNNFLIFLGIIFLIIIAVIIFKPFNIDLLKLASSLSGQTEQAQVIEQDEHPLLNSSQENILESVGIDVKNLPTEVSSDQEDCVTEELGQARVDEIKNGSTPSIVEILKIKHCFE